MSAAGNVLNATFSQLSAQNGSPLICMQQFVRKHLLDHAARLDRLARIGIAGTAIFVAAEHAAGHLAVAFADFVKIRVGRLQLGFVVRLQIMCRRVRESLRRC